MNKNKIVHSFCCKILNAHVQHILLSNQTACANLQIFKRNLCHLCLYVLEIPHHPACNSKFFWPSLLQLP